MANRKILNDLDKDKLRAKIKSAMLIREVQAFALGTALKRPDGKMHVPKMTPTKLRAILALLNKTLPDLKSEELTIEDVTKDRVIAATPQQSEEEWAEANSANVVSIKGAASDE